MSRRRGWLLAAVAAALAISVVVSTGLLRDESESAGGPVTPIRQADADAPHALWIGDSYTVGYGTKGPAFGYACLVSDLRGWTCELDAQSGTGFVNAGAPANDYSPLDDRLARTNSAFGPDLVVIDAGRNDREVPTPVFRRAVTGYFADVHEAFPDARFAVVLPFLLGETDAELGAVNGVLRNAARAIDATVVDTTTPEWTRMINGLPTVDAIHPTAASHAVIARRLVGDFRRLHVLTRTTAHGS